MDKTAIEKTLKALADIDPMAPVRAVLAEAVRVEPSVRSTTDRKKGDGCLAAVRSYLAGKDAVTRCDDEGRALDDALFLEMDKLDNETFCYLRVLSLLSIAIGCNQSEERISHLRRAITSLSFSIPKAEEENVLRRLQEGLTRSEEKGSQPYDFDRNRNSSLT